ncbi:MAG: hypothetical protein IIA45_10560 [Bacteroidetes bacterium]|nr:hypothetical protein [Bacteroidota bacterium]
MNKLIGRFYPPDLPEHMPANSKWLPGAGSGVWFHLSSNENMAKSTYRIRRYNPAGELECDRNFVLEGTIRFDPDQPYEFSYISHCQQCHIIQKGEEFTFNYIFNEAVAS